MIWLLDFQGNLTCIARIVFELATSSVLAPSSDALCY